jgi:protein-S-isoprenylcysteine O-methyltransferase Ste14
VWLARHDPDLLAERMTGQAKGTQGGQKGWDLVWTAAASLLFIGWFALMGLDAVRFGWSNVPVWLQAVGALLVVGSFWLFFAVFRANSFLSPVVRVQKERGQKVIDTGPYAVVRHPMYAAVIPFALGTSLLLGSWWGLVPAALLVLIMAWRAVQEERTLRAELPGYVEYAARVRYRLIPGVW